MSKFYRTANFVKLKKEWSKALKDSGFKDVEYTFDSGESSNLTHPAIGICGPQPTRQKYDAKVEYYTMAAKFLHDYPFDTELDRLIWEHHANGLSYREIVSLNLNEKVTVNFIFAYMKKIRPDFKTYIRLYSGYKE